MTVNGSAFERALVTALAAALAGACGGVVVDGSGHGGSSGAVAAGGRGVVVGGSGGVGTGGAAVDPAISCMLAAKKRSPSEPFDDPSCGFGCLCARCATEVSDCYEGSEPYCVTILECARARQCVQVACYKPETCQAVIDNAPNGGLSARSVAVATMLMDCATKNALFSNRPGASCSLSCP